MGGDDLGDEPWLQDVVGESDGEEGDVEEEVKKRKSRDDSQEVEPTIAKRRKSPELLIAESGRRIEEQSEEEQATLVTAIVKHYSISSLENPIAVDDLSFPAKSFIKAPEGSFADRLRPLISMKKLRKWNCPQSPCVVIMCMSARRAVMILKELTSLKCRIAKLFPKNGTVEQQTKELQTFQFPIVIGTPHRLAALCGCKGYGGQVLKLHKTMLLVIDSHVSNKMYSVISLPDTAPDCAALLRDAVHPQLKQRQDLRITFI